MSIVYCDNCDRMYDSDYDVTCPLCTADDEVDLDEDEEEKALACPFCSEMNAPMVVDFGGRTHYRCRNCGIDYSVEE